MKAFHLVCVGKLKDSHLEALEADYLKRINNPPLIISEVKASAENPPSEADALLKKIREMEKDGPLYRVAMTEWGKRYTSLDFAKWSQGALEKNARVVFLIAGAEGFAPQVLETCQDRLSLSELTFPHKLARLLLIEQLYRAQTLRMGHPYHN